jgi:hypothetical protein
MRVVTKYLWYNGSTSFVDGEELKQLSENEEKSKGLNKSYPYLHT